MKKNLLPRNNAETHFWENRKAIIVLHEATTGLGHDLRDYLLDHSIGELLFIVHPLLYMKETFKNSSRYELYKKGKLIKTHYAFHWVLPEFLLYIKDFFYTLIWCMQIAFKSDLYVGLGNLNAFSGYVLKLLGLRGKTVFYVIDYVPLRFHNKLINSIYHRIEKIAAEKSDWTWNLSPRMIEGRNKRWHKNFSHQLVVPHGVHFRRIKCLPLSKINKQEILYMGTIFKKQGIQLVIESFPKIISKIPDIRFSVIGKGPYEEELKKLVARLGLGKHVDFLGYIPNHAVMEDRIARAAIAVALYDKESDLNDFTYYADPGKIKNYLGAGVPVIMTDVPYVARQVEKAKCGFIISYSKDELVQVLIDFLLDMEKMKKYRANALKFAKKFDWDRVFTHALNEMYQPRSSS